MEPTPEVISILTKLILQNEWAAWIMLAVVVANTITMFLPSRSRTNRAYNLIMATLDAVAMNIMRNRNADADGPPPPKAGERLTGHTLKEHRRRLKELREGKP